MGFVYYLICVWTLWRSFQMDACMSMWMYMYARLFGQVGWWHTHLHTFFYHACIRTYPHMKTFTHKQCMYWCTCIHEYTRACICCKHIFIQKTMHMHLWCVNILKKYTKTYTHSNTKTYTHKYNEYKQYTPNMILYVVYTYMHTHNTLMYIHI